MKETIKQLLKLLKLPGARKQPYTVRNLDDLMVAISGFGNSAITPMFTISSVDGTGVPLLRMARRAAPPPALLGSTAATWPQLRSLTIASPSLPPHLRRPGGCACACARRADRCPARRRPLPLARASSVVLTPRSRP